jgi:hypothetical protein
MQPIAPIASSKPGQMQRTRYYFPSTGHTPDKTGETMPTQNLAPPIARTIPIAHPFAIAPDTTPDKPTSAPDKTVSAPHPDDRTHTIAAIAKAIEVNEATLRRRWLPKLLEAYAHYPEPLRVEVRKTANGTPVYEISEYGFGSIRAYKTVAENNRPAYLAAIAAKYPAPHPSGQAEALALIEADRTIDEADSGGQSDVTAIVLDAEIMETRIEERRATEDQTQEGALAIAGLLQTLTTAINAVGEQTGLSLGAEFAQGIQRGFQKGAAAGMQATVDAAQGKAIE